MSYNKNIWKRKDRITKEKLNHMEDGIHDAHDKIKGAINDLSSQIKDIENKKNNIYSSLDDLKADSSLKIGMKCKTLGYFEENDGGEDSFDALFNQSRMNSSGNSLDADQQGGASE